MTTIFMEPTYYQQLVSRISAGETIPPKEITMIFDPNETSLLPLLDAAFAVRRKYWGTSVKIHILNNVKNGSCSEDCHYCAQSTSSKAPIETYSMKSDDQILDEAKQAYAAGAFRHCLVFSGQSQTEGTISHLADLVRKIKSLYPMQVCVSPGVITPAMAETLKKAGLDRINHNINTSHQFYPQICSTHTYEDRLRTLKAAQSASLEICSGIIVGMGESIDDIINAAVTLRTLNVASIPVNFLIPILGNALDTPHNLTPDFCLRVLCAFRFINPKSEIRIAAGREIHLRSMEVMALYPANSLFIDGYLNVTGSSRIETLQMIMDAGFTIESDKRLDELLAREKTALSKRKETDTAVKIKTFEHLNSG